jgi:cold shock CspA family protein
MGIDRSYEIAKGILSEAQSNLVRIKSEEDAKLQIITRLLIEALGWTHGDIASESRNENGFSDYLVTDGEKDILVIEAKRIGEIDIGTQSSTVGYYKLSGPVLKAAAIGLKQAASYCHPLGIQLAVLTDGVRWVIFLPWIPQANYMDKQAILFPGFDAILANFAMFYELLSKEEARKSTFRVIFDRIHENRLALDRPLGAAISRVDNSLLQKSALAFDLESVFANFFAGMAGDRDPDMLIDCFVETRESRVADFSLEKITKNVLGNIVSSDSCIDERLQTIVQNAIGGELGQTIFIVGPSGAGKTTFLDRFFARTLSSEVRERCVVIGINTLDASSNESAAITWMTNRAIASIERQLFSKGYPEWNDLQALYHIEYIRRSEGIDANLYKRSKEEFKEKFASYVESQVESDRDGYLNRLLRDIVNNRKKLPVFVIDNTDEFSILFKISVFQHFQSLRRAVENCLLIFPVTDRSAWSFSKTEIFNIYSSKSFFLPTPSPREVFRKRIEYIKGKLNYQGDKKSAEYFASRGIRITISDLGAFAAVVETIFVDQDYAAKRVGELANYNMRESLGLSKRVITSSIFKVEDLIRSYIVGGLVAPSPEKFMNALMKGDYEFFREGDEPLLFPLFQVDSAIRQSPLIHIRLLILLRDLHNFSTEDIDRYIPVGSIVSYFGVMSISDVAVQKSLVALLTARLVEPYDLSIKEYSADQRIAITHSGLAHIELGLFNPVFFEQMALTTRISDTDAASRIRGAFFASKSINARLEDVREQFCSYLVSEDERNCNVPQRPEYTTQFDLREDLSKRWTVTKATTAEMMRVPEIVAENVTCTVERFDHSRGFGFVEVPGLRETAFLHASVLERGEFPDVYDGDDIICDIKRNNKGLAVSRVTAVYPTNSKAMRGTVAKLMEERGYGFVHVPEIGADAFFHFHLLSPERRHSLVEGEELSVEVKTDKEGRSQVRRILA